MTMQPHTDMLRALAARMSGATGVPLSQFGVMTDSGPSSSEAIMAAESELVIEAKNACRAIGVQLRKAARDIAILNTDSDITRLLVDKRKAETRSVLDSLVNGGNKDDGQPATGTAASQPSSGGGTGTPRSGETVGDAATAQP